MPAYNQIQQIVIDVSPEGAMSDIVFSFHGSDPKQAPMCIAEFIPDSATRIKLESLEIMLDKRFATYKGLFKCGKPTKTGPCVCAAGHDEWGWCPCESNSELVCSACGLSCDHVDQAHVFSVQAK